jgi:hypothetical protein
MLRQRIAIACCCLAGLGGLAWLTMQSPPDASAATPAELPLPADEQPVNIFTGVGSCASGACHGSSKSGSAEAWQSSYTVWALEDKHSRAYRILFELPARQIVAQLDKLQDASQAKPFEDRRCLGCHASVEPEDRGVNDMLVDGVGCEACHGAAGRWLAQHTTWQERDVAGQAAAFGMNYTKDFAVRARVCVDCHVGAPQRPHETVTHDMNHDLIAAGHPRLTFELTTLLAQMPRHWNPNKPAAKLLALDESQAWALGQAVTARAAIKLLGERARRANQDSTAKHTRLEPAWPEFSEYECFSCHHSLHEDGPRPSVPQEQSAADGRRLGGFAWGDWHLTMTRWLANRHGQQETLKQLTALTALMSKPFSDPQAVVKQADASAAALDQLIAVLARKSSDGQSARETLLEVTQSPRTSSWDEAAQTYLACVAIHNAYLVPHGGPQPGDEMIAALEEVRRLLLFDSAPSSARAANATLTAPAVQLTSPADFDPAKLKQQFERVHKLAERLKP